MTPAIETRTRSQSPRPFEARIAPEAGDEQREHDLDDVVERADERDRRRARLALSHVDLDLREPQSAAQRHERRLHLRVVVRVLLGEELDRRRGRAR